MRLLTHIVVCLLLLSVSAGVRADVVVFVQGYLGDENSWRSSGITAEMEAAGWADGGRLIWQDRRIRHVDGKGSGARVFYTVGLDTQAPLFYQLSQLAPCMEYVRARHSGESLVIVGHSAGGVLGRLYMVEHPQSGVGALITIASPHHGTDLAELGLAVGQSPIGWVAPLFGGQSLGRSQALYVDLLPERQGTLLYWLNRQPHPVARYVSVVRHEQSRWPGGGDLVVPAPSQDMNTGFSLRGQAYTLTVPGGHSLVRKDGKLLLRLLDRLHEANAGVSRWLAVQSREVFNFFTPPINT